MKKHNGFWLLVVGCMLLSCLVGFFIGRNFSRSNVEISTVIKATKPLDSTQPSDPSAPTVPSGPIDINAADSALLQTLPGIGPTLAQRIIDYRNANGPFGSVYDLTEVSGIGLAKLESILDLITIGGEE